MGYVSAQKPCNCTNADAVAIRLEGAWEGFRRGHKAEVTSKHQYEYIIVK